MARFRYLESRDQDAPARSGLAYLEPRFRFQGQASDDVPADSEAISPFWSDPEPIADDVPQARTRRTGANFRNYFDRVTVGQLENLSASGDGVRVLYGSGNPPPLEPGAVRRDDGGSHRRGLLSLIGAGLLISAAFNRDQAQSSRALVRAAIGGGMLYLDRRHR